MLTQKKELRISVLGDESTEEVIEVKFSNEDESYNCKSSSLPLLSPQRMLLDKIRKLGEVDCHTESLLIDDSKAKKVIEDILSCEYGSKRARMFEREGLLI